MKHDEEKEKEKEREREKDLNLSQNEKALIKISFTLGDALQKFREINQRTHFISLNASIEGARMKSKITNFSIVAEQIVKQGNRNSELSEQLEQLIKKIKNQSLEALAIRNLELAVDLIDKLDRNLFERNCDVQAWASFDVIINALSMNPDQKEIAGPPVNSDKQNPPDRHGPLEGPQFEGPRSSNHRDAACSLLEKLVSIYVVYLDSFLIDAQGKIVAAARARDFIGQEWPDREEFSETIAGSMTVSEIHFNPILKKHTVHYCAPVMSNDGQYIGILVNCFDWSYALEMIHSGDYEKNIQPFLIDLKCRVIGSDKELFILNDTFQWLRGGELASMGFLGYCLEHARNGEAIAVGYCRTKGYNSYKGKGWSALMIEHLGDIDLNVRTVVTENRNENIPSKEGREIESEKVGKKLKETMKEIDGLVYNINVNNREVKLLAVNASIQSGLAGADGEGFAIIANEVASLAKKSLNFVEQVNETTNQLRVAVDQSISIRLVDAAKDTMSKIDRNLFERYCDIQAWSTFSKFAELLLRKSTADTETLCLLEKIHKIYEVYHDIYILSVQGKLVASAVNRSLTGHDYGHKEWFSSALNGGVYSSDIYISETLKVPLITFSAPIYDSQHNVIGVVASRFNCNFINDIVKATIVDSESQTFLLNQSGLVIGAKEAGDIFTKDFTYLNLIRNGSNSGKGFFEEQDPHDKETYAMGFSKSHGYNTYKGQKWTLVTRRKIQAHEEVNEVNKLNPVERFKAFRAGLLKIA